MSSHRIPTRRPTPEERDLFEVLVAMRERYPAAAALESRELTSVHHAIAAANVEMQRAMAPRPIRRMGIEAN